MNYNINYLWEQGSRHENEDSIAVMQLTVNHTPALFALVSDGIGGMDNGEMASGVIANRLKCAFENASYNTNSFKLRFLRKALKRELYSCHADLCQYADKRKNSLGATCSLICLIGNRGFILHIGDSRIYLSHHNLFQKMHSVCMTPITKDHIDANRHLTRCIGHGLYSGAHYHSVRIKRNSLILLCTDGFYKRSSDYIPKLPSFINTYSFDDSLNYIYTIAKHRGEQDNACAILIQLQ